MEIEEIKKTQKQYFTKAARLNKTKLWFCYEECFYILNVKHPLHLLIVFMLLGETTTEMQYLH